MNSQKYIQGKQLKNERGGAEWGQTGEKKK